MRDLLIKNVTYDNALYARNGNYNYNTDGQKAGEGRGRNGGGQVNWYHYFAWPFLIRLRSLCHKLSATTRTLE